VPSQFSRSVANVSAIAPPSVGVLAADRTSAVPVSRTSLFRTVEAAMLVSL
jgi:hypothetical protein